MSTEEVDALAHGRVWSASDARDAGLVDNLGSLQDAIAAAADIAGVEDYEVDYVELPLSPREMLLKQLANRGASLGLWRESSVSTVVEGMLAPVREAADELAILQDPRHLYMRCLPCGRFSTPR